MLIYSLPSFLPADVLEDQRQRIKKHLRVLRACPVALEDSNGVCSSALLSLADLFIRGSSGRWYWGLCIENSLITFCPKKILHQSTTVIRAYIGDNFNTVIEPIILRIIIQRSCRAPLEISCTKNDS